MVAFKAAGGEAGKKRKDKKAAKDARAAKRAKKDASADRPKMPAKGAFAQWLAVHREEIASSLPPGVSKITGVTKAASERWKAISDMEKEKYEAKYKEKQAEYLEAVRAWKASKCQGDQEEDEEALDMDEDDD